MRLVAAVVSGAFAASSRSEFESGRVHLADMLQAFGSAGDTSGALFLVGSVVLLWWLWRDQDRRLAWLIPCVSVLLVLSVLAAVTRITGLALLLSPSQSGAAPWPVVDAIGLGVADLLVMVCALLAMSHIASAVSFRPGSGGGEGTLFAVDRGNSEVFAFFSPAEVTRTLSAYGIEDDEFAFYDHAGRVVEAVVAGGQVHFTSTEHDARTELLAHLQRFADDNDIGIDAEGFDDPTAYAVPINEWQWLQLWPGWLRGIGHLIRRFRHL